MAKKMKKVRIGKLDPFRYDAHISSRVDLEMYDNLVAIGEGSVTRGLRQVLNHYRKNIEKSAAKAKSKK